MHNIVFLSRGWHQFAIKERMDIEKHRKNMERKREGRLTSLVPHDMSPP
jgi:hypothetical protein